MALSLEASVTPRVARSALAVVRHLRLGLRLAGQLAVLALLFYAGTALVQLTSVPLPGNLVGMLLLLGLLRLGLVRLEQVQDLAGFALKHLNFFFIPLAVGLMTWSGLLAASGLALGVSLFGSAVVCLATAGLVAKRLVGRGGDYDAR